MSYLKQTEEDMQNERALLREYERALSDLPEGRLVCKKIKGTLQYYHVQGDGKEIIINKKNLDLILDLKLKKRLKVQCKQIETNLHFQENLLKHYKPYETADVDLPYSYREETLRAWANEKYKQNTYKQDMKIFKTSFGLKVRSKSEVIIAEMLHEAGIPFRYDPEIILYDKNKCVHKVSPDFVIMTPSGRKIIWEHWGLFGDEGYRACNYWKLELYFQNDIILSDNLIITMDTKDGGIDAGYIERVIKGQVLIHFN